MKLIQPSQISGSITAPMSKSIVQRTMISDVFAGIFNYPLVADAPIDVEITYKALKNILVGKTAYLGESGFSFRVLPIIASLFSDNNTFILSESLAKRPNDDIMGSLGFNSILSKISNNQFELSVAGKLNPGVFHIDGSKTSQTLTGLLMALPLLSNSSIINVSNLQSRSYVDLTIDILSKYSIEVFHSDYEVFHIQGNLKYKYVENYDEGDWSSSAFIMTAGAISILSSICIKGLNINSRQADREILDIFDKSGVHYRFDKDCIYIEKSDVKSFVHDFSNCPDLVPAIIPLAINSENICILKNVSRLKYKESNRIESLISQYEKCGVRIQKKGDDIIVYPAKFQGNAVSTFNDHRIAMSLAVAALNGINVTSIENPVCTAKSYPEFWNDLLKLGADIYE